MSKSGKNDRRHSAPLPVTTAATAQHARSTANAVISGVLQQAIASRQPTVPQQEGEDKMEVSGNGTAATHNTEGGSRTAGPETAWSSSRASRETGQSSATPTEKAEYRNYHLENDDSTVDSAGSGMLTTARYKNIQTQRLLRGEHTAIGSGPSADSFKCGDIFLNADNRNSQATLVEDNRALLVSTNSFSLEDLCCVSCDKNHPLLPRAAEQRFWEGGRQLIFLTDHNMPAILPSEDGKCPIIIRVDGGLLREIGTNFMLRISGFAVPEGSVVVIGSVTHLMEEGRVGYTKALVTEYIRFSKAFRGTVHIVPFLPPPLGGTNDPELIRAMLDVLSWLEKLQKWDMSAYYNAFRAQIYGTGTGAEQTGQNTQRHKMPKSYDAYNDKVFICHPWTGIGSELPAMDETAERVMILELMEGLASNFKWNLDVKPTVDRQQAVGPAQNVDRIGTELLLIGGSNCQRLYSAIADQGVSVESVDSPGWVPCPKAIDSTIAHLGNVLPRLPTTVPVVIWGLDNACFRSLSADGDLSRIVKDKTDNRFHVPGDLAVTPYVLLKPAVMELKRLLEILKDRDVWILDVLPRFLLCFCCDNKEHCAKVRQQGPAGVAAGRKILGELGELNAEIAAHLTGPKVKFVSTGDLLTGVEDSSRGTLMDALYETWNQDAVHGERIAYTKLGLALLKLINKKNKNNPNKRSRENRSPSGGGLGGDEGRRVDYRPDGPSATTSSTSRTGRERSRSSHTASYDRRRGSPPGRRGGYRREY